MAEDEQHFIDAKAKAEAVDSYTDQANPPSWWPEGFVDLCTWDGTKWVEPTAEAE
jgi:hypothetical protein|tara:strand:+ start:574 stop:738 length:165 start_codon:yes stop_codon:yes gene_type:complete